jgi:D-proline reductase (dithiol) PrdB
MPLKKPLAQCKVGMVSTSGCYVSGDIAYFHKEDASARSIPSDTPDSQLRFSHLTENYLTDARRDPNCVFPLRTLHRLVDDGVIGSLADTVFSCMGANYSSKTTLEKIAPEMAERFLAQNIDAALVVPM